MVKSQAGGGDTGNQSGQLAGKLDRDQFWIDLHAFATSPRGLGLDIEVFQALSWKEVAAHKKLWAEERAEYFNANFTTDGTPWISEDFLAGGNRETRREQKALDKLMADKANRELEKIIPAKGKPIDMDLVPIWVIPMKDRKKTA